MPLTRDKVTYFHAALEVIAGIPMRDSPSVKREARSPEPQVPEDMQLIRK